MRQYLCLVYLRCLLHILCDSYTYICMFNMVCCKQGERRQSTCYSRFRPRVDSKLGVDGLMTRWQGPY